VARPPRTRTALTELLERRERHDWSIEELQAGVAAGGLDVDFSTVYRAVEGLVADGELRRVELGTAEARYERAGAHHEHVRCGDCGQVAAVESCAVEGAIAEVERATGFTLTGHDLVFHGLCPRCREAA
jgi:Fur family ferric uptake transcriptional regulator